jgi:glyoxylate reductase
MTRPVVLLHESVSRDFQQALEADIGLTVTLCRYDPGRASPLLDSAVALIADAMGPVTSSLIAGLPAGVGLIANIGVGVDNIDLPAARAAGIRVSNTPVVTEDTADLAMLLILAACRQTSRYERLLRAAAWSESEKARYLGTSVHGKTLGIIGFGAIGQALACRARAFSMRILYHGPRAKPAAAAAVGASFCPTLDALLESCDVISLNCSLTEETRHLLDAARLAKIRRGAILINTGRGALIDEAALVESLRCGHLGGAGLDVYEYEPSVSKGLLELDTVTLLPHVGSATHDCRCAIRDRLVENIVAFVNTGTPLDVVDCA